MVKKHNIMKKHELLEKAMRDYPAGTKFKWRTIEYTSTGSFSIDGDGDVACGQHNNDVLIVYNRFYDTWATIIKPTILSEKCAIQVNNEREFKLLMEHYEVKGWKWKKGHDASSTVSFNEVVQSGFPTQIHYRDLFQFNLIDKTPEVSFSDFAAEVGIEVPVFVMKSEDGVDLYVGDDIVYVWHRSTEWAVLGTYTLGKECGAEEFKKDYNKAFSTEEAAEAWVKKANKPEPIKLFEDQSANVIIGTKEDVPGFWVGDIEGAGMFVFDKDGKRALYYIPFDELDQAHAASLKYRGK